MPDVMMRRIDGTEAPVGETKLQKLARSLRGSLLTPRSSGYDEARAIWNGMIDRRPGLIVRCAEAGDIATAVDFARGEGLLASVRGAGHNIAGNAVSDGGLMIDLSGMRSVEVDPKARTARVGPGATLADVDAATAFHGLAPLRHRWRVRELHARR